MAKSKKIDIFSLVIFGVMVLAVVMAIVGVCIAYTSATASAAIGGSKTTTSTLADWAEVNDAAVKLGGEGLKGFGAMSAFAYITLVLSAVTAVVFVVSKFVNVKFMKWVLLASGALLIVSAVVALITAFTFCSSYGADIGIASTKCAPAAGAWLLAIFSVISGAAGVVASLKK